MTDESPTRTTMSQAYTARQGQFLAYIHQYSLVNGCAPAEADMQRFFSSRGTHTYFPLLPAVHTTPPSGRRN